MRTVGKLQVDDGSGDGIVTLEAMFAGSGKAADRVSVMEDWIEWLTLRIAHEVRREMEKQQRSIF